ncbi:RNA polymerase II [Cichlidogyrus casuarinus]|uniref:RNA polymerase II n=1 Tax=Cichlidogyrus casuarinus TaxID=1844966 RepID=A0ABD2Q5C5_9PLAT
MDFVAAKSMLSQEERKGLAAFHLVSPLWLWACYYRWERISAKHFPLFRDFHRADFEPGTEPSHRYMRRLMKRHNIQRRSRPSPPQPEKKEVKLDTDLVKSALESIHAEISADRQERKKRKRISLQETEDAQQQAEESSESLSSYSSAKQITTDSSSNEATVTVHRPKLKRIMSPDSEPEDLQQKLQSFLPKEHSLILADNPLMHMAPGQAGEMMHEIEEAVFEEQKSVCAAHPPELEIYDPAKFDLDDSLTSTSDQMSSDSLLKSSSTEDKRGKKKKKSMDLALSRQPEEEEYTFSNKRRKRLTVKQREQARRKRLIRMELLVRRRTRASPDELKKINSQLRKLQRQASSKHRRQIHSSGDQSSDEVSSLDLSSSSSLSSCGEIAKKKPKRQINFHIAPFAVTTANNNQTLHPGFNQNVPTDATPHSFCGFNSPHIHSDPGGFVRSVGSSGSEDLFSPSSPNNRQDNAAQTVVAYNHHRHPHESSSSSSSESSNSRLDAFSDEEIVDEYLKNLI